MRWPKLGVSAKPEGGIWYAWGDDWYRWILNEGKAIMAKRLSRAHVYVVNVNETEIARINSRTALQKFHKRFSVEVELGSKDDPDPMWMVDWAAVRDDGQFAGFESRLYDKDWASPESEDWWWALDVPSGCIWDERGLDSLVYRGTVADVFSASG